MDGRRRLARVEDRPREERDAERSGTAGDRDDAPIEELPAAPVLPPAAVERRFELRPRSRVRRGASPGTPRRSTRRRACRVRPPRGPPRPCEKDPCARAREAPASRAPPVRAPPRHPYRSGTPSPLRPRRRGSSPRTTRPPVRTRPSSPRSQPAAPPPLPLAREPRQAGRFGPRPRALPSGACWYTLVPNPAHAEPRLLPAGGARPVDCRWGGRTPERRAHHPRRGAPLPPSGGRPHPP